MRGRFVLEAVVNFSLLGWIAACGTNEAPRAALLVDAGTEAGPPVEAGVSSTPEASVSADSTSSNDGPSPANDAQLAPDAFPSDAGVVADTAGADAPDAGRNFSTDRTLFLGPSRCAQAGVQLCEDFESGAIDKTKWTVSGTPPVVDGIQFARGSKALHITQKGGGGSYIKETLTFPAAQNTYFGRAFVYFNSLPQPPMTYAHWTILAASGTGVSGEIRVGGQFQNGKNLFGVGTDNRVDPMGTGDWTNSDKDPAGMPSAAPLKQWLCIEWMHKGSSNETRFWWDAIDHPSLFTSSVIHGGNPTPYLLPQFRSVWLGWQEYQPSTETFELWIDEIAIDKDRIGCVL